MNRSKTTGANSRKKQKSSAVYDLELLKKGKKVPVKLIEDDERSFEGISLFQPTSTNLDPIRVGLSEKDVSILDIGFDTEYLDPRRLRTSDGSLVRYVDDISYNYLISTQFYVHYTECDYEDYLSDETQKKLQTPIRWSGFILHNPFRWPSDTISAEEVYGNRLNFSDFIHLVLQRGFQLKLIDRLPKEIQLFAHTNIADLDKFKDLHEPKKEGDTSLVSHLTTIRRSYANLKGIQLAVDGSDSESPNITCKIGDTINLTPVSGSLKALGEIVNKDFAEENLEKLELGEIEINGRKVRAIENMSELALQNFRLFYDYAMQDARIPVFFIQKVRTIQQSLFLQIPKLPSNFGSYPIEKKKEFWIPWIKKYFSLYNTKATLTSIGENYLRNVVWANKGYEFYTFEETIKSRKFYNPNYSKPTKPNYSLNWKDLLGIVSDAQFQYGQATSTTGKTVQIDKRVKMSERYFEHLNTEIKLIEEAYFGGRNEQFFFGISPKEIGTVYDYDLVSAYPTAMLCVGRVDWTKRIEPKNKDGSYRWDIIRDWDNYLCFFEVIRFNFPESVQYPTIPVRNKNRDGIIFPKEGGPSELIPNRQIATRLSGVEIDTAMRLGCELELGEGVIFKMDPTFCPYEKFIKRTIIERRKAEHAKDEMMKLFWKEMMNSVYGKTAQGISKKKTYDINKKKSVALGECQISSYPLVGIVTAFVRSVLGVLMNEIHQKNPNTFIGNITTDGFATNFPNNEKDWKSVSKSPIVKRWLKARSTMEGRPINTILNTVEEIDGKKSEVKMMIEQKHSVERYVGWRTRGQSTLYMKLNSPEPHKVIENDALDKDDEFDRSVGIPTKEEEKQIMNAKGGQRTPLRDAANENIETVWWFLNRFQGLKYSLSYFNGLRGQIEKGEDAISIDTNRAVSMDFDFKRMPIESSISEEQVEYLDVLDHMNFRYTDDKKALGERYSYFTADFKDLDEIGKKEWLSRRSTTKSLCFKTRPIKDLDEYETVREYWRRYKKVHLLPNEVIDDEQWMSSFEHLRIPREEWIKVCERALGKIRSLPLKNGEEVFEAEKDGILQSCSYAQYRERIEAHLNNDGLMNSSFKLKKFFQFFRNSVLEGNQRSAFYSNAKSGQINIYDKHVKALCLARSMDAHGLDQTVRDLSKGNEGKMTKPDFYWYVWNLFYSKKDIRIEKKLLKASDAEWEEKARIKIRSATDRAKSEFQNLQGEAEKWTAEELKTESDLILSYLLKIKEEVAPNINLDVFTGKIPLHEGLGIFEKDRRPRKTKEQRETDMVAKRAVKGFLAMEEERKRRRTKEIQEHPEIAQQLIDEEESPQKW